MQNLTLLISKLFKSKTLILGWLTFVVGLLSFLVSDQWIAQYPQAVAIMLTVLGVLQAVVRLITKLPLSEK